MRQLSLLVLDHSHLAGLLPAIRAAMRSVAGGDDDGRKLLVDKINAITSSANLKLSSGNSRTLSKDTLDKWLACQDRDHVPSIMALIVFCQATENYAPLRTLLNGIGLDLMTDEDIKLRDYGRACLAEKKARKKKKALEDSI